MGITSHNKNHTVVVSCPDVTLCPVSVSKLSEAQKDDVVRRYPDGATAAMLAGAHKVSVTTVKAVLRERGARKRVGYRRERHLANK